MVATLDHLTKGRVNLGRGSWASAQTNTEARPIVAEAGSYEILSRKTVPCFEANGRRMRRPDRGGSYGGSAARRSIRSRRARLWILPVAPRGSCSSCSHT